MNEISLLLRHRDRSLIDRYCSLVKVTGEPFLITTAKNKEQWAVTTNINSRFVQRLIQYGYRNIAHVDERPMPEGSFDLAIFLRTYAQLHYLHDSFFDHGEGVRRQRIRIHGSTAILEAINRYLYEELGCGLKKIQNHKISTKTKILYYQSKREVPKVLQWLNGEI